MNWGIIATGNIAHKFATTVQQMDGDEQVTAVASRNLSTAKEFAEEFNIPMYFGSYSELIESDKVDAIYVATPNLLHAEVVKECILNGKPVLCEKPLTTSRKDSEELYNLAKEQNVFLMEAFWIRFLPMYDKLRAAIADGIIGKVNKIDCQYGFISSGPRRLTKLLPELGGGALMDIGIYCIGFLQMINPTPMHFSEGTIELSEYGTDEACDMNFMWDNGCTAHIDLSLKKVMDREATIYGETGKIILSDFQNAVKYTVISNSGEITEIEEKMEINGFEYQIRESSTCIKEGRYFSELYTPEISLMLMGLMDDVRAKSKK